MITNTAMGSDPTHAQGTVDPTARQRARLAYLQRMRPNDPQIKILQQQLGGSPASGVGTPAPKPTNPADATKQAMLGGAQQYQNLLNRFQNFDPYQMQQNYSPVYDKQAQLAQQNVMNQFNQMNREEFQRQNQDVEQEIAQRGLDPASPAADYLRRNNQMRQDRATQEAQMNAINAGYNVQNQMFGQASATAMMPYQQWQTISQPFEMGMKNQYDINLLNRQNAYDRWKTNKELANRLAVARLSRGGAGGMSNANLDSMILNSLPDPNSANQPTAGNAFATGMAAGVGRFGTQG